MGEGIKQRIARCLFGPRHLVTLRIEWGINYEDWLGVTLYGVRGHSRQEAAAKGIRKASEDMPGFRRLIVEVVPNVGE